jgi:hypothetical protein
MAFCRPSSSRHSAVGPGHELAKDAARLLATLLSLALQGAVDLRRDREPHLAAEHDGVFSGDRMQADDMTVETPRHAERGGEHRTRIAICDDCQNRFHHQSPIRFVPFPVLAVYRGARL